MNASPSIRIIRGQALQDDPCAALQASAAQSYGPLTALQVSLMRGWYAKNNSIFRIAVTFENLIVGYLSTLPLFANIFEQTLGHDFQEKTIAADDLDSSWCSADGGIFISSIVVASAYQRPSPASLPLRLAFIEDLIDDCAEENQAARISAQALSLKGEACMRSLGMRARDRTPAGWKIYYGQLSQSELLGVRKELQHKLAIRL